MESNFFDPTLVKYEIVEEDEEIQIDVEGLEVEEKTKTELIEIKEEPPLEIEDVYFDSDSEYNPDDDCDGTSKESELSSEGTASNQEYDRTVDCVQCGKQYRWLGCEEKPTTKRPVRCRDCGEKFFNKILLEEHYASHEGDCKCYPCDTLYDSATDLANHQLQFHYERFMCYSCALDKAPTVEKQFRKAALQRPSAYVYGRCKICKHESDANFKMKKHFLEHHPGLELDFEMKCNDCDDAFFSSRKSYRRHRDGVHRRRQKEYIHAICHVCDKYLVGYDSNFKEHFKIKHPENEFSVEYKCPNCNEFFKTNADIIHHRITIHKGTFEVEVAEGAKRIRTVFARCNVCQKQLSCRFSIERHFEKIHPGVELNADYKCQQCDKFFNSEADVTKHRIVIHRRLKPEIHSKEEKVLGKCDICRRFFTTKASHQTHFKTYHPGVELVNHKCQTCNKLFNSEADVKQHFRIKHQHQNVKHKCQTCKKLFKSDAEVTLHFSIEHQKTVQEERKRKKTVFGKCNLCKKLLSTKFVLDKHFENKHPGEKFDVEYKCQNCAKFFKSREAAKRHSEIDLLRIKIRR